MNQSAASQFSVVLLCSLLLLGGALAWGAASQAQGVGTTTHVSISFDGKESDWFSKNGALSGNGRYVAFLSAASNLVPNDTNSHQDVFVRDRQMATTTRVSVGPGGVQANNGSEGSVAVTQDGRFIVFSSFASNLVGGDSNNATDTFIHDQSAGTVERVSLADDESQSNGASSGLLAVSADGRYVVFTSNATNLVLNDTNATTDIFVRDRQLGITERVNIATDGTQANNFPLGSLSISSNGRLVAFSSNATTLVPNDTNNRADVFLRDRVTNITQRISVNSSNVEGTGDSLDAAMTPDGRYIAFYSYSNNLVANDTNNTSDIFVYDRETGIPQRVSFTNQGGESNALSQFPVISADGRYIAFESWASNLVFGDTVAVCDVDNDKQFDDNCPDIFVRDRLMGETVLLSVATTGEQAEVGTVGVPSISNGGDVVVFSSNSSNLAPSDPGSFTDVFARVWFEIPPTPTPTNTAVPPTPTPTNTAVPPTSTPQHTELPSTTTITARSTAPTLPSATPTATTTPPNPTATVPAATPTLAPGQPRYGYLPLVQHRAAAPPPTVTPPACETTEREPNNVFLEADNQLPLCEGSTVVGSLAQNDVNDIYRLQITGSATLQVDLTNLPANADYDLYLYDARGGTGQVAVSNIAGSAAEQIRVAVTTGRYYLRVVSLRDAAPNTYQLRWRLE